MPLLIISACSSATQVMDNNCKSPKSGTGIIMMDIMHKKMHTDINNIKTEETTTELLFNEPVTEILSDYYSRESYNNERIIGEDEYKEIYSEDNPRNLIIKFTFKSIDSKENIFLVSSIANDYECGVRFNGYTIVKREF